MNRRDFIEMAGGGISAMAALAGCATGSVDLDKMGFDLGKLKKDKKSMEI